MAAFGLVIKGRENGVAKGGEPKAANYGVFTGLREIDREKWRHDKITLQMARIIDGNEEKVGNEKVESFLR